MAKLAVWRKITGRSDKQYYHVLRVESIKLLLFELIVKYDMFKTMINSRHVSPHTISRTLSLVPHCVIVVFNTYVVYAKDQRMFIVDLTIIKTQCMTSPYDTFLG